MTSFNSMHKFDKCETTNFIKKYISTPWDILFENGMSF